MPAPPSPDLSRLIDLARAGEDCLAPAIRPGAIDDPTVHAIARLVDALDETAAAGPHLPPDDPDSPGLAAAETEFALGLLTLLLEAVTMADRAADRPAASSVAPSAPPPDRAILVGLAEAAADTAARCLDRVGEAELAAEYRTSLDHARRRLRRLAQTGPAAATR